MSEFSDQKFSKEKYLNDFDFWWQENPSVKSGDKLGWIIEDTSCGDDYVKGFLGNIPIEYELNHKDITTYNASTWYVHPKYRKEAVLLVYAYFMQDNDFLVNTTPSEFTKNIFMAMGCRELSSGQKTYIKINSNKTIKYFLSKKIAYKYIANILSFLSFYTIKLIEYAMPNNVDVKIDEIKNIERFKTNRGKIYIKNLDWLLRDTDKKAFRLIKNGQEVGYIITQFVSNVVNNLKYLQILDHSDVDLETLNSISGQLQNSYSQDLDFVLISNYRYNKIFSSNFFNVTFQMQPSTLVKTKSNLNIDEITSIFGEKGVLLWK